MATGDGSVALETKEWILQKENELRFEVGPGHTLSLKIKSGTAEIFGTELAPGVEYKFTDTKLAVFTWLGCVLETRASQVDIIYVSDETPMVSYINLHAQLEARRETAVEKGTAGPKVLVVGRKDSGKTSLCKLLLSYALRLNRTPTYVDLDVAQGSIVTIPGTIAASPLDQNCLSVQSTFQNLAPLGYFYGDSSPTQNPKLYKKLVERLAASVKGRLEKDALANASGVVINTSSLVDAQGVSLLVQCAKALEVDVVVVLGDDRLVVEMRNAFSSPAPLSPSVTVVKLAISGGVVQRNDQGRLRKRNSDIREYFYGKQAATGDVDLSPTIQEISFREVKIFKVTDVVVTDAVLPVGQQSSLRDLNVHIVTPSADLNLSIMAVCHIDDDELGAQELSEQLVAANVAGFVCVQKVNVESKTMTVLAPCPGPRPSNFFLVGSLKWME